MYKQNLPGVKNIRGIAYAFISDMHVYIDSNPTLSYNIEVPMYARLLDVGHTHIKARRKSFDILHFLQDVKLSYEYLSQL